MKKILTLMAAMAAASSAMATDYVWTIDEAGKVEGSATENILTFDKTNSAYSFSVNAGEQVWVKTAKGNAIVTLGSTVLTGVKQTFDMEGEGLLYNPNGSGTVTVTLPAGVTIEKIKVVSANSMKIEKKFKAAQEAVNTANQKTAKWATGEFSGFFSAVRAEINKQGAKNQEVRAELEGYQKVDAVDKHFDELDDRLDKIITDLSNTVTNAETTKDIYDKIVGADATALRNQLENGKKEPACEKPENFDANTTNGLLDYIYDWKKVQVNKVWSLAQVGPKTSWIEDEWKRFNTDIAEIKTDALAQLAKFPNSFETGNAHTDFQQRYDNLRQAATNVVARAIFERDHKSDILALNDQMVDVENVANAGAPFDLSKASTSDYMLYKEYTMQLAVFVNADNDRRLATKAELDKLIDEQYTPAKKEFDAVLKEFRSQAEKALGTQVTNVQKNLDETAYKISAKYVNEKETQKKYEAIFADIQNRLNTIADNATKDATYAKGIAEGYKSCKEGIESLDKEIGAQWTETLSAQKREVLSNNSKKANELLGKIETVRNKYNENVKRIQGWIDADWCENDTVVSLKANLNALFSVAGGMDKMHDEIVSDTVRYTKLINDTPDIEFNANDNQYRLLNGDEKVDEYIQKVAKVETDILDELKKAVFTANGAAKEYLTGTDLYNNYKCKAYGTAWDLINAALSTDAPTTWKPAGNLYDGSKSELMSKNAVDLYKTAYNKIIYVHDVNGKPVKDDKGICKGLFDQAEAIITAGYAKTFTEVNIETQKLADKVGDVEDIYKKVQPAVEALDKQLADYKELYKAIYDQKVEWALVKADADKCQKVINDNKGNINVVEELKEINKLFDGKKGVDGATEDGAYTILENTTEKNALKASELKEGILATVETFKERLFNVAHYDVVVADKNAKTLADAQIAAVETQLTAAYETIKDFKEDVKATATTELDAAKASLETIKGKVETAFDDHTLAANYEKGDNLKQAIEDVATEIAAAVEKAQKANKNVPGDYTDDGVVDSEDLSIVVDKIATGEMKTTDYTKFLTDLDNYRKNL